MEQTRLFIIVVTLIKMKLEFACKNAVELNLRHQRGLLHRTGDARSFLSLFLILPTGENGGGVPQMFALFLWRTEKTHIK